MCPVVKGKESSQLRLIIWKVFRGILRNCPEFWKKVALLGSLQVLHTHTQTWARPWEPLCYGGKIIGVWEEQEEYVPIENLDFASELTTKAAFSLSLFPHTLPWYKANPPLTISQSIEASSSLAQSAAWAVAVPTTPSLSLHPLLHRFLRNGTLASLVISTYTAVRSPNHISVF